MVPLPPPFCALDSQSARGHLTTLEPSSLHPNDTASRKTSFKDRQCNSYEKRKYPHLGRPLVKLDRQWTAPNRLDVYYTRASAVAATRHGQAVK